MMKIRCEHCGGDLTKTVRTAFARYDAGPIECPDCHALQSRRLTQVDFLIDLGVMLSLLLALVLLLPVFVGIRTELRSFLNLLFLGSGILFLDQFRFLLYRVSPTTSKPLSAQEQCNVKNRANGLRLICFGGLILTLIYFNTRSSVILVLTVSLIVVVFCLLLLRFY